MPYNHIDKLDMDLKQHKIIIKFTKYKQDYANYQKEINLKLMSKDLNFPK